MKRRPLVLKVLSFETECYDNIRNSHRSGEALEARAGAFYNMASHPSPALLRYPGTGEPNLGALLSSTLSFWLALVTAQEVGGGAALLSSLCRMACGRHS